MKNKLILCVCLLSSACSGEVKKNTLSEALKKDPYKYLAAQLSRAHDRMPGRKVAVLPFFYTDRRESEDGVVVSEKLLTRLIQEGELEAVERNLLEKVMGELKLQHSGAVDETSIKSLGKILGVEAVVTGTLTRQFDGRIEINARLIKAETAVILSAATVLVLADWETLRADPSAEPVRDVLAAANSRGDEGGEGNFPKDWKYRENLRVAEKSGSSLVDYQVLVKFDSAAAIKMGRMKPDCSDLRFANSNETAKLNFWLERGCNTADTRAWVRLPFLAKNGVKNIYMYYGNPSVSGASSGGDTFRFFEDFNSNTLDPAKWRSLNYDSCSVQAVNQRAEFSACSSGNTMNKPWLIPAVPLEEKYVLDADIYGQNYNSENSQFHGFVLRWCGEMTPYPNNPLTAVTVFSFVSGFPSGRIAVNTNDPDNHSGVNILILKDVFTPEKWFHLSLADDGSQIRIYVDGELKSALRSAVKGGDRWGIYGRDYPVPNKIYLDNVRLRKYAEVEPYAYAYHPPSSGPAGGRYKNMR